MEPESQVILNGANLLHLPITQSSTCCMWVSVIPAADCLFSLYSFLMECGCTGFTQYFILSVCTCVHNVKKWNPIVLFQ